MRNSNIYIALIILTTTLSYGQNISDVVRWSSLDPMGTARTMGVGSAFGAMGGDFSVVNINPSGIAEFRVSEFTFTPSMRFNNTTSSFVADSSNQSLAKRSKLGLDNIGFVICRTLSPKSKWTSSNFAVGYSRVADINRNVTLQGKTKGSITEMFAERANGSTPEELDEFVAYPAFNTGAIFDIGDDKVYETDFAEPDLLVSKTQDIIQNGGINELAFGWAGEYERKLNLGFSVGVPIASFEELKTYTETDPNDDIATFRSLEYTERLNTSGVGINFKAGFTYKPNNIIRLGGAFHSPTWYRFTDDFSTSLTYSFDDGSPKTFSYDSKDGTFDYRISNPWRAIGSLGTKYRIGDIVGFVDADVEYLDYTNADYNGTAYSSEPSEAIYTREVNKQIQTKLGTATNIRLGTELGYKNLRLRAGYSWEQSAYNADDFYNNKLSFGFGFRDDRFFMDFGLRISDQKEGYNAYVVTDSTLDPLANINTKRTRGALTLGFKF